MISIPAAVVYFLVVALALFVLMAGLILALAIVAFLKARQILLRVNEVVDRARESIITAQDFASLVAGL